MSVLRTFLAPLALLVALAGCAERELILEGERLDLRATEAAAEADPRAVPFRAPPARSVADWPQTGGGADHDPGNVALSGALQPLWTVPIGEGNSRRHRITAEPVVAGGRVFTLDSRARVSAVSTGGAVLWSEDLTPARDRADDATGGGLASDGARVYASSGFGRLTALDAATGARVWTQDLGAAAMGAPAVLGARVFVTARDGTGWAVDAETGRVLWTVTATPSPTGIVGGSAPAATAEAVVMPFASGELVAVSPQNGTRLWTGYLLGARLGPVYARITEITGDPVISGGRVYAGNHSGETAAIEFGTGQVLWRAGQGALGMPVVAGGSVFLISDRNELTRLDAGTGAVVWTEALPFFTSDRPRRRDTIFAHYGPRLVGGRLAVASDDGQLRFFDPEAGGLLGAVALPQGAATAPVVAGGTLYVVTENGALAAFR